MIFIDNGLAIQLKEARSNTGYSQNDVATILHITRQSVSKWERGIVYPDLDNLIRLSDIYKVSIDDLVNKNSELKSQIKLNNKKIKEQKEKLGKVNTQLYQNTNEGIFYLFLF
ncbi:helix-turn-helix domain-containing protein [Lentilactobacillus senioris]|uniref:helix-turn-helix domain-containing protein n=1 Tax=Lentilactobacillus senioris TaxID=931534 RepID=UPI000B1D9A5A|nr:helix-turn-helix transcriptional regulator [Lentilactobacillus senioris]